MGPPKKPRRRPLRSCLLAVIVFIFAPIAGYLALVVGHQQDMEWTRADMDKDGIPLMDDLDADGDGTEFPFDHDCDNDGEENTLEAVQYAVSMEGIPTDFLMGKYFDVLGRIGRIVCVDVPVRSWLAAGCSFPALLKKSAAENPEWFEIDGSNAPDNRFFYRRVRNYHALFSRHPGLETSAVPQAGDWAFYGLHHVALVIEADGSGNYRVMEAYWSRTAPVDGKDVESTWGRPDFFGRVRSRDQKPGRGGN